MRRYFLALVVTMLCVTACGDQGLAGTPNTVQKDMTPPPSPEVAVSGTLESPGNGCVAIRPDTGGNTLWVVWPEGTSADDDGVVWPSGKRSIPGDSITLTGYVTTRNALPSGDDPDSMWGSKAGFCIEAQHNPELMIVFREP